MTSPIPCTCGEPHPHQIARRLTADGIAVVAWSDGSVTGRFGALDGVPVRRPRTVAASQLARSAAWLLLGEACLYDADELPRLYAACEKVARRGGLPGDVRAEMRRVRVPPLAWTVAATDRDGTPTERYARLPRLRWPGLVVLDFCGGQGSSRGRYVLARETGRSGTVMPTGFAFTTLEALWAHLATDMMEVE